VFLETVHRALPGMFRGVHITSRNNFEISVGPISLSEPHLFFQKQRISYIMWLQTTWNCLLAVCIKKTPSHLSNLVSMRCFSLRVRVLEVIMKSWAKACPHFKRDLCP